MVADYARHKDLEEDDICFIFMPIDLVLLRKCSPNKLKAKCKGPYTFI